MYYINSFLGNKINVTKYEINIFNENSYEYRGIKKLYELHKNKYNMLDDANIDFAFLSLLMGNDYLEKDFNTIKQTVLRIANVFAMALDKNYKQNEYLNKLYKLYTSSIARVAGIEPTTNGFGDRYSAN